MTSPDGAEARWAAARACDRILSGGRPRTLAERLADLSTVEGVDYGGRPDMYGDAIVATLEERVAALLGKPAAVFFPTGTMAQQVALRCWAEAGAGEVFAMHPLSHLEQHERHAYASLSGLRAVWPTTEHRSLTAEDIRTLDEPFGTLLLELPLRDAGYLLPRWDELVALTAAVRERGARVHFDGARIWETTLHFGQDLPAIAGLADSVYVSFYKTLEGIAGAALTGSAEFVAQARAWRHRYGGNVFQHWPAALAALAGLDRILPALPSYVEHARMVASVLAEQAPMRVHPRPPHTHQFQLWLPYPVDVLNAAGLAMAVEEKTWFASRWFDVPPTGQSCTEITVSAAALEFTESDVRATARSFLSRLPSP